ncbi:hypothetical protein EHE21_00300 [Proteus sp. GOKU]|uniref:hypothetical protein n=1 Tax=Proteus TaxID=583 RepID=UPI001892B27B|nr:MULTISPECIES: hypothetical protein [Proteus]QPB77930.1 hypothetical protein EHE21_00300 [Proteus sp. GOKU]QQP23937.1 hypothetical protein D7029_00300 [Proteus vulgaris]
MEKTQKKNSIFIFLIILSLIYFPKIGVLDFTVFLLAPLSLYLFITKKINIKKEIIFATIILLLIQSYVIITSTVNGVFTSNVVLIPIRNIIIIFSLYITILHYKLNFDKFIKIILYILLINTILIFIQFILHLNFGIIDYLYNPQFPLEMINTVRKPGYFTGYPVAGFISNMGAIFSIYIYRNNKKFIYIYIYILFFITSLITARTALLFNILILPFVILSLNKRHFFYLIIIFIISTSLFIIYSNNYTIAIFNKFKVVFEFLIEQKGDHSTNDLIKNHYKLPNDLLTFSFGNALDPQEFSDVGYVQAIFKGGMTLFSITLFFYFYLFTSIFKNISKNKKNMFFILSITSCFIFYNFKGPYLLSRTVGDFIIIIFTSLLVYKASKNENHE